MNVLFDFIILMKTDLNWFLTANGFLGKDLLFTADTLPVFGIDEKNERLMVEIVTTANYDVDPESWLGWFTGFKIFSSEYP